MAHADFLRHGLDPQSAKDIVDEAVGIARSRALRMLIGSASFAAVGLLVTVSSYSAAMSGSSGATYWAWYGPVIAGGIASFIHRAGTIHENSAVAESYVFDG